MSKAITRLAVAGATLRTANNQGGGPKKQGLVSTIGRAIFAPLINTRCFREKDIKKEEENQEKDIKKDIFKIIEKKPSITLEELLAEENLTCGDIVEGIGFINLLNLALNSLSDRTIGGFDYVFQLEADFTKSLLVACGAVYKDDGTINFGAFNMIQFLKSLSDTQMVDFLDFILENRTILFPCSDITEIFYNSLEGTALDLSAAVTLGRETVELMVESFNKIVSDYDLAPLTLKI